jgi:hypothetical protein
MSWPLHRAGAGISSRARQGKRRPCFLLAQQKDKRLGRVAGDGEPDLLRARDWVLIGSVYSTDSRQGSLDEHLKRYLKRATAGWVAVVLETAAVITIDRSRPAQVKLRPGW